MKSTMDPKTKSPFFSLPPEIQNEIYHPTFEGDLKKPIRLFMLSGTDPPPGIILACKQSRSEAIGMYYSSTTFQFQTIDSACAWLLNTLPKSYAALFQSINIRMPCFGLLTNPSRFKV